MIFEIAFSYKKRRNHLMIAPFLFDLETLNIEPEVLL